MTAFTDDAASLIREAVKLARAERVDLHVTLTWQGGSKMTIVASPTRGEDPVTFGLEEPGLFDNT